LFSGRHEVLINRLHYQIFTGFLGGETYDRKYAPLVAKILYLVAEHKSIGAFFLYFEFAEREGIVHTLNADVSFKKIVEMIEAIMTGSEWKTKYEKCLLESIEYPDNYLDLSTWTDKVNILVNSNNIPKLTSEDLLVITRKASPYLSYLILQHQIVRVSNQLDPEYVSKFSDYVTRDILLESFEMRAKYVVEQNSFLINPNGSRSRSNRHRNEVVTSSHFINLGCVASRLSTAFRQRRAMDDAFFDKLMTFWTANTAEITVLQLTDFLEGIFFTDDRNERLHIDTANLKQASRCAVIILNGLLTAFASDSARTEQTSRWPRAPPQNSREPSPQNLCKLMIILFRLEELTVNFRPISAWICTESFEERTKVSCLFLILLLLEDPLSSLMLE
jgi:hypothetical protein